MTVLTEAHAAQVREALGYDLCDADEHPVEPCGRCKQLKSALALLVPTEVPQDIEAIVRLAHEGADMSYVAALIAARDEALVERCVVAACDNALVKDPEMDSYTLDRIAAAIRAAKEGA